MLIPILIVGLLSVAVAGTVLMFIRSLRRQGAMLREVRTEIDRTSAVAQTEGPTPESPGVCPHRTTGRGERSAAFRYTRGGPKTRRPPESPGKDT